MIRKHLVHLLLALLLLSPLTVSAQTTAISQTYTWTAPTEGSAVVSYEVEVSYTNGTSWALHTTTTTASVVISVPALQTILVRVRAVDALGRKGLFSNPSDPYFADPGPPGACGKPSRS